MKERERSEGGGGEFLGIKKKKSDGGERVSPDDEGLQSFGKC